MKEIEEVKRIFLAEDIDEETRQDNLEKVLEWERELISNENFLSWQEHDITKQVMKQARETYKECALQLATSRTLTETQRQSLWAKQDAALWMLSLTEKDTKAMLESVHREIMAVLRAV